MTVLGVIFWLGWHLVQFRQESRHLKEAQALGEAEKIHRMIERY